MPKTEELVSDIEKRAQTDGRWKRDRLEVILIQPELEAWIWQRNIHVVEAFEFPGSEGEMWKMLNAQSLALDKRTKKHHFVPVDPLANQLPAWPIKEAKPKNPKGIVEALSQHCRSGPASGVFKRDWLKGGPEGLRRQGIPQVARGTRPLVSTTERNGPAMKTAIIRSSWMDG